MSIATIVALVLLSATVFGAVGTGLLWAARQDGRDQNEHGARPSAPGQSGRVGHRSQLAA